MQSIHCYMNDGVTVRAEIHGRFLRILERADKRLADETERLMIRGLLAADDERDDDVTDFDEGIAPAFTDEPEAPMERRCGYSPCHKALPPVPENRRGRKPQYCDKLCRDRALRERKA